MLSRALLAIVLAVCTATLPGAAPAAPAPAGRAPALTLKLSDTTLDTGQSFTATGKLAKADRRPVLVQARTGSTWKTIAKGRSSRRGTYSVRVPAPAAQGRVLLRATAPRTRIKARRLAAATSRAVAVTVTARASTVTARVARTSYVVGETVEVSATVSPATARPLELQRQEADGTWRTVGAASSTPQGVGTLTHLLGAGTWSYRLSAPASAGLAAAVSPPVQVSVSAPVPPVATRVQVVVTGLPIGTASDVLVSGPGQAGRVVTGDTVLDPAAPGDWTVTTRPVRVGTDTYHGVEDRRVVSVVQGATTSIVVDYGVIVPESTTVAPPSEIASVTDLGDGTLRIELAPGTATVSQAQVAAHHRRATDRLVRSGMAPDAAAAESTCRAMANGVLCEGNIFVAGTSAKSRDGIFARVANGGLVDSNTLLVTTRGATLTEAVKLGRTPTADLNQQLEVTKKVETKDFTCSGTLKVQLEASAEIDPRLDFTLDVAWGRLTKAQAIATIEQDARLVASLTGTGECQVEPQDLIDKPLPPVTVHLGPIPVVLSPQLHVTLDAEGRATGTSQVGWTEEASARFGLTYDGSKFEAFKEIKGPTITRLPAQFQGEAAARATLTAGVDVLLYGVAGPRIAADASLTANATATGTAAGASINWRVGYDVSAYAQFVTNKDLEMGALGIESDRLPIWGPHTRDLFSGMVAWDPGADYFPRITTTSLPPAEVGVRYDQRIQTADNRPGYWELDGTLPEGLELDRDSGRVTGIPTRVQDAVFGVRFIDGQGRRAYSEPLSISVVEPSATLLPDAFAGHPGTPDYYERLPRGERADRRVVGRVGVAAAGRCPHLQRLADGPTDRPRARTRSWHDWTGQTVQC